MQKTKLYPILIVIGLILIFIVGPIFRTFLAQITLDQGPKQITEESMTGFKERYSKGFSLSYDQTCHIEFSNYYPNVTVYLIILTKNEFDYYNSLNGSSPTTGEPFILFRRQTDSYPLVTSGLTSMTLAWSGSTYGNFVSLEFRGNNRVSIPGNYYVVVRGENSFSGNENVRFNIKIAVDGPGKTLQDLMVLIGVILISVIGLIWVASFIKKTLGGR